MHCNHILINPPLVVGQSQVTAYYMLQQTCTRLFGQRNHHFPLQNKWITFWKGFFCLQTNELLTKIMATCENLS